MLIFDKANLCNLRQMCQTHFKNGELGGVVTVGLETGNPAGSAGGRPPVTSRFLPIEVSRKTHV